MLNLVLVVAKIILQVSITILMSRVVLLEITFLKIVISSTYIISASDSEHYIQEHPYMYI